MRLLKACASFPWSDARNIIEDNRARRQNRQKKKHLRISICGGAFFVFPLIERYNTKNGGENVYECIWKIHEEIPGHRPVSKGSGHFLILALAAGMLTTLFNALTPQIIRFTVDHLTGEGTSGDGIIQAVFSQFLPDGQLQGNFLILAAAAVLISASCAGIFTYFSNVFMAKGSEGFLKSMRDQLYRHIQRLPYSWHGKNRTGDIIQRCTNDVEIIRQLYAASSWKSSASSFLLCCTWPLCFP